MVIDELQRHPALFSLLRVLIDRSIAPGQSLLPRHGPVAFVVGRELNGDAADRRVGVEFKRVDMPTLTPAMRIAMSDLALDRLTARPLCRLPVVYPGAQRFELADRLEALRLWALLPLRA